MTRRRFVAACSATLAWLGFGKSMSGCDNGIAYEVRVSSLDNGASVYQATARQYQVLVETRSWQNLFLAGVRKVVAIDGMRSEDWVFEINGFLYNGNDAAEITRVRTGQVITWRTV